jgi:hypothetical protein
MLSFKQRVTVLRFKRRVVVWVQNHRLFTACLTAATLLTIAHFALRSQEPKHNKSSDRTDSTAKETVEKREGPEVAGEKAEKLSQKTDSKEGKADAKPLPDHKADSKSQMDLEKKNQLKEEKARETAGGGVKDTHAKEIADGIRPSDPRFLTGLMCVIQSAVSRAGNDIRELKQKGTLQDVKTASLKSIARRLRGRWPNIPLSSLSGHLVDDVIKSETLQDDSDCKIENFNVHLDGMKIIINPVDSLDELDKDLLDHVTTSACVLYQDKPVAGLIYQPFLKRSVSTIINHRNDPENRAMQDEGRRKISMGQTEFSKARSLIGDYALPNPRLGGIDYGILSMILDPSKPGNEASTAMTHLRLNRIPHHSVCAADALIMGYKGRFTSFQATKPKYDDLSKDKTLEGLWVTLSSAHTDGKIGSVYTKLRELIK